jgi:hypothetical protein
VLAGAFQVKPGAALGRSQGWLVLGKAAGGSRRRAWDVIRKGADRRSPI